MALVSTLTLDPTQPMSLEETVRLDSLDCGSISYHGPVIYSGGHDDGDAEGSYWAEYISCFPGDREIKLWVYTGGGAPFASPVSGAIRPGLGIHRLRLDWYPGDRVVYWLDEQVVFTADAAWVAGHGGDLSLAHPPHPALWFGSSSGVVLDFQAWGASSP